MSRSARRPVPVPDRAAGRFSGSGRARLRLVLILLVVVLLAATSATLTVESARPAGSATAPAVQPVPKAQPVPTAPTASPTRARSGASGCSVRLHWGDTLGALAHQQATSVAGLQRLNHLGHSTRIYAGRKLTVPCLHGLHLLHRVAPGARTSRSRPTTARHTTFRHTSYRHTSYRHTSFRHTIATQALTFRTTRSPVSSHSASAATAAVRFARAQVGKPYRWGSTGPNSFDCSGLVMRAWQAGGVRLPRVARAQAGAGRRTTRARLRPGDLVVTNGYGHIALYAGRGQVIQAPHTGARVKISPLPRPGSVDAYVHPTVHSRVNR